MREREYKPFNLDRIKDIILFYKYTFVSPVLHSVLLLTSLKTLPKVSSFILDSARNSNLRTIEIKVTLAFAFAKIVNHRV